MNVSPEIESQTTAILEKANIWKRRIESLKHENLVLRRQVKTLVSSHQFNDISADALNLKYLLTAYKNLNLLVKLYKNRFGWLIFSESISEFIERNQLEQAVDKFMEYTDDLFTGDIEDYIAYSTGPINSHLEATVFKSHSMLEKALSKVFTQSLETIGWPNVSQGTFIEEEFRYLFKFMIRFQTVPCMNKNDAIVTLFPFKCFALSYKMKFTYHFSWNKETNQLGFLC